MAKYLVSRLMVLFGLFVLSACGARGDIIQFYLADDQAGAFVQMAEKYYEETGVEIEIVEIPNADLMTTVTNMTRAGEPPALVRTTGIDPNWGPHLLDLSEITERHRVRSDLSVRDSEGITRAIAADLTVVGLFINTDLFSEAGVLYPTSEAEIWTWDEFIDALDQIVETTDARYGLVIDGSDHRLRAFTYQFGGQDFFLSADETHFTTDEETIRALETFIALNDDRIIPKSVWTIGEDPSSMFKSGRIAAHMSGSWQVQDYNDIDNFNWKVVYMPYQEVRSTNLGGNNIVAFEGSEFEAEALDFLDWLYTPENYETLCALGGYLPVIEGMEIDFDPDVKDSFDVFVREMEAAGPIASRQMIDISLGLALSGQRGVQGVYRESMARVLNNEITLTELLELVAEDYKQGHEMR